VRAESLSVLERWDIWLRNDSLGRSLRPQVRACEYSQDHPVGMINRYKPIAKAGVIIVTTQ
jgi:hypothetical protein